ncbi:unnamed protein product [Urochloa humidicola]
MVSRQYSCWLGMETWLIGLKGVCFGIAFRNKAHKDHCDLHNLTTNVVTDFIATQLLGATRPQEHQEDGELVVGLYTCFRVINLISHMHSTN